MIVTGMNWVGYNALGGAEKKRMLLSLVQLVFIKMLVSKLRFMV
jgi:hypothetical protein